MPNELDQSKVMQLIKQLINMWSYWEENRSFYLEKLIPQLKENPSSGTKEEQLLFQKLKNNCSRKEWGNLAEIVKLGLVEQTLARINQCLTNFDFDEADKFYEKIADNYPRENYQEIREKAWVEKKRLDRENFVRKIQIEIMELLEKFDFESAREKWLLIEEEFPESEYIILENESKKNKAKNPFRKKINELLSEGKFVEADQLFHSNDLMSRVDYIKIKAGHLQNIVNRSYKEGIDDEQALAISALGKHKLVSARAGSGKTRVLACTTSILVDLYHAHPDEILVLAFNKKAVDEIRDRIKVEFNQPSFRNARTFHSLAYQLVKPSEDILCDEKVDISTKKLSLFVQKIIKEKIKDPAFILKILFFFKKEYRELEKSGEFLSNQEYYDFRRNLRWVTLNGDRVKSKGEKYIADYFFEHGIVYKYEDACYWNDGIYRPDFMIFVEGKKFIWEHWGIDINNSGRGVPEEWGISWSDYRAKIKQKRKYWNGKKIRLIETFLDDLDKGRQEFEEIIRWNLSANDITAAQLSRDEIIIKLREKDYLITRLTTMFANFIQKAKKRKWTAENIDKKIAEYGCRTERESVFLELAKIIFIDYEAGLIAAEPKKLIDYDDLIIRAIDKVHQAQGKCRISIGYDKKTNVWINDLRWILIDEYQDFSQLFYEVIDAIRQYNSKVQIICVGDDWQAINSFAGSNLQYFNNFSEYFKPAKKVNLLTNHRSRAKIVQIGNELMAGRGDSGQPNNAHTGGEVKHLFIDDVWLQIKDEEKYLQAFLEDKKYIIRDLSKSDVGEEGYLRLLASKYVKQCCSIITDEKNIGLNTVILSRTNYIEGVTLGNFRHQVISALRSLVEKSQNISNENIEVRTAHSYKGGEADLVIILNVCNGSFPLLHPDNALYGVFRENLTDAMDEERRLFYVALTRAEEKLYIISERDNSSIFLNSLSISTPGPCDSPWERQQ